MERLVKHLCLSQHGYAGNSCIGCESCMQTCPLEMRIPEKIARAHAMLG